MVSEKSSYYADCCSVVACSEGLLRHYVMLLGEAAGGDPQRASC